MYYDKTPFGFGKNVPVGRFVSCQAYEKWSAGAFLNVRTRDKKVGRTFLNEMCKAVEAI